MTRCLLALLRTAKRYCVAGWRCLSSGLSSMLCRVAVHSWDYGPGECCSQCGAPDRFYPDALPGRRVVDRTGGCPHYVPHNAKPPDGWEFCDE